MRCPKCDDNDAKERETGNGGELYVAEDTTGDSTECFDADIKMYQCKNGHIFYV